MKSIFINMLNVCRMDSEETKREKSRKNALGNKRKCLLAKFPQ